MTPLEIFKETLKKKGVVVTDEAAQKLYSDFMAGVVIELVNKTLPKLSDENKMKASEYIKENKTEELFSVLSGAFPNIDSWRVFIKAEMGQLLEDYLSSLSNKN